VWDIRISRLFDAPREAVYQALTDAALPDVTVTDAALPDVTVTDATAAELLSGTTAGMRLSIEFHDEPPRRTRLILTQGPCPADLEGPTREGWSATFAQLDKRLARPDRA
jgi:hypothetical protein